MAKDIKKQLWDEHLDAQIPELVSERIEKSYIQLASIKLANPEKNFQLVQGLVLSCKNAWSENMNQKENNKDEITIDASSLWKVCVQRKDIYKLANNLQYQIHCNMPEVYAKIYASCDQVTVRLINKLTMKTPFVEVWLTTKVNQRQTELTFDKLESFYKIQPVWVQRKHDFIRFLKNLFETVKNSVEHLLSFKIDRYEKKVILQYAS